MAEWITPHRSNGSEQRGNSSEAFSDDWGSYETAPRRARTGTIRSWHASKNSLAPPILASSSSTKPYTESASISQNFPPTAETPNEGLPLTMTNPKPSVRLPDDGTLNREQRLAVESILSGYSTFFSGPAGTGKSHILSHILRLNEEGKLAPKKRIVVTASTGIAACNVGGTTIHSFAGVGMGEGQLSDILARVMRNKYAKERWRKCDILIIDEVSMMSGEFLDNLNFVASRARNDRRDFGGIQVVLCGDFFQLPPVNLERNCFAFEAKCWSKVIKSSILLKQIFRQNGDPVLMRILNEARVGELSPESTMILKMHSSFGPPKRKGDEKTAKIKPTLLECRNAQVDRANSAEMSKLNGDARVFDARDRAASKTYESQLKHCSAPEKLELKVGAQVILLKNLDPENGLVNGSRGVIVDFSRPKSYQDIPREFRNMEFPVVQFDSVRGSKSSEENDEDESENQQKIIEPAEWTNKIGDNIVSSRFQIPLRLAWALSVHKSQGMTIPHLTVSLQGVFEYGQAYVALSRATKLDLLTLRGFNERSIKAHPKVKSFYASFEGSEHSDIDQKPHASHIQKVRSLDAPSNRGALTTISKEQQQRIEQNRLRALELQKKRAGSVSNGNTSKAAKLSPSRNAINNPYR